ncbi:helix-turn-helix transcriptional regulator [Hansschlegelia plantiphila]|uniref:Transcriptional regulator n=1 Tax=Hansschlegelia plantiphila TaxID=374655 RepID=A0A9W6IXY7_9HYPH|nr:AraC family transcriptional regulator [Hansschlegelia plantiphila]GLK67186.1 transcriptional regulator [Hansschlegelia plantiphila]
MTGFRPRMQARRDGISVVAGRRAHQSEYGLAELWDARCAAGGGGDYASLDPRLFIVLEPLAASLELATDAGMAVAGAGPSVTYVPAGAPVSARFAAETGIRHLDLHFARERIDGLPGVPGGSGREPRLLFADERVMRLARLLAAACASPGSRPGLYDDGLFSAIIAAVFRPSEEPPSRRSALSDSQLRQIVDYIEDRCLEPIRLADLAALTGLSETYVSHAFKAATGTPPHRWQLNARIRRAQAMLRTSAPLIEISVATGFSDQPHFTKVFRRIVGITPSAWRGAIGRGGVDGDAPPG